MAYLVPFSNFFFIILPIFAAKEAVLCFMIQTGAEEMTTVELESFETFSMKRTVFDARGIRTLSSNQVSVFVFDNSETKLGRFPKDKAQFSTTEALFPTDEA